MKPAPFRYLRAESLDDAVALLAEYPPDAKVLAGGQSLIASMNRRKTTPSHLIDIMWAPDLRGIATDGTHLEIRAGVRQAEAEHSDVVLHAVPLLSEALQKVAYSEVRNAGTVCGSVAYGDPLGEIPTVVATMGGEVVAVGPQSRRTIPADRFFVGPFRTVLESDEVLAAVRIPVSAPSTGYCFREIAPRKGGYAVVGAAAKVTTDKGVIVDAAVGLLGVAPTPFRSATTERLLVGAQPSAALFEEAAARLATECDPVGDLHGTVAYRRHLAGTLSRRALAGAHVRIQEAT